MYLHGCIDGGVRPQAEIGPGDVVADGSRDNTHGDAELIVMAAGVVQLLHTFKPL